jgi:phage terminase large subunit-like protein
MTVGLLPDPTDLTDAELLVWLEACSIVEQSRKYVWERYARPDQLPPKKRWLIWFMLGGRGAGKTRTGSETCRKLAEIRPGQHGAIVAPTHREVLNICFEAPRAGLAKVVPPWEILAFLRGSGSVQMTLTNGSVLRAFSAQDPDAMRGYAFDFVWLDEYASYPAKTAQDVFDQAWFCMREAIDPHLIVTTTPKAVPWIKKLVERAKRDPLVVMTRSKTSDNRKNLSEAALAELDEQYAGTRLGRQELDAELLEDVEGALWTLAWIDRGRVHPDDVPPLIARDVAIDPAETVSATSDETGIVVAGYDANHEVYVLADKSMKIAGLAAAYRIWDTWIEFECRHVIIEGSSLWMLDTLELAWREYQANDWVPGGDMPVRVATPFASKEMRASPVATMYEKDPTPVHHVGIFGQLEEQLTTWVPGEKVKSPDRMDALVYVVGEQRHAWPKEAVISVPKTGLVAKARASGVVGPGVGRLRRRG